MSKNGEHLETRVVTKGKDCHKGQSFTDSNWRYDSGDIVEQGRPNRFPNGGSEGVVGEAQEG